MNTCCGVEKLARGANDEEARHVTHGFLFIFFVFRENSYGASTIQIAEGQTVISTGPYALVRHPMYAGALVMLIGTPLALGIHLVGA